MRLCKVCGLKGEHDTASECISALRSKVAALRLALDPVPFRFGTCGKCRFFRAGECREPSGPVLPVEPDCGSECKSFRPRGRNWDAPREGGK